jgi:hypothetical protein
MSAVKEDFIEEFLVIFYRSFDFMSDVRINEIIEMFEVHVVKFIHNDAIIFLKCFPFYFLDWFQDRLFSFHIGDNNICMVIASKQ